MYVTIQTSGDTVSHQLILSLFTQNKKLFTKELRKVKLLILIIFVNEEREMYERMLWSETPDTERYQTLLLSHICKTAFPHSAENRSQQSKLSSLCLERKLAYLSLIAEWQQIKSNSSSSVCSSACCLLSAFLSLAICFDHDGVFYRTAVQFSCCSLTLKLMKQ